MPIVPEYKSQVQDQPLPSVRVSPDASPEAFGAGQSTQAVGQAAVNLSESIRRFAFTQKYRADQVRVLSAEKELSDFETQLMDGPEGAYTKKGLATAGLIDSVSKSYGDKVKEINKGLSNDEQRTSFGKTALSRSDSINKQLNRYVNQERYKAETELTQSSVANARDQAIKNYDDPEVIDQSIAKQTKELIQFAQRNGKPKEWLEETLHKEVSDTHKGVIDRMLANRDDLRAQAYYDKHKDFFTGNDAITLEKSLSEGALIGNALRNSDRIMGMGLDRTQALEEAAKIKNPRYRIETEKLINHNFDLKNKEIKELQDQAFLSSFNKISETNNTKIGPSYIVPPGTMSMMTPAQQTALNRAATGNHDERKFAEFGEITPQELSKMNAAEILEKVAAFDRDHQKQAMDLWKRSRDQAATGRIDSDLMSTAEINKRANLAIRSAGILTKPNDSIQKMKPDDLKNYTAFSSALEDEVNQFVGAHKRKPYGKELDEILDRLTMTVFTTRNWVFSDKKKSVLNLTEEEKKVDWVPYSKIPQSEVDILKGKFQSTPTNKQIEDAYGAYLSKDRKRFNQIVGQ